MDFRTLINAVCDFEFVFGLILLKMILLNTNGLSKYLQGKSIHFQRGKVTAEQAITPLTGTFR